MTREKSKTDKVNIKEKSISEDTLRRIHAGYEIISKDYDGCGACIDICPKKAIKKPKKQEQDEK